MMALTADNLDRRITIERATVTHNAYNEPVETWTTFATVWAKRADVSDAEKFAAGQVGSYIMSRFTVRHSTTMVSVKPNDRIVHEGRTYNIQGVKETQDGRRRFLEFTAVADLDA